MAFFTVRLPFPWFGFIASRSEENILSLMQFCCQEDALPGDKSTDEDNVSRAFVQPFPVNSLKWAFAPGLAMIWPLGFPCFHVTDMTGNERVEENASNMLN
jgi:hypothetical protein